ncbi:MAG: hypothetical protein CVU38_02695 [Chloroflexi bacterium HGW-Chloroflexi-1]|nr:MAG: hypothetical protein CVU38_02695 [Chloroflexi bacterium HGW-Chloroflexi-1]
MRGKVDRRFLTLLVLALLWSLVPVTTIPAAGALEVGASAFSPLVPAACPTPPPGTTTQSQAQALFDAVNAFRVAQGLPKAVHNQLLENTALAHSQDMSQNDYFSHIGSDGSTPRQRVLQAGYNPTAIGENLAGGHTNAHEIVSQWAQNPSHLAVMLQPTLREIGVGYVYDPNDLANVDLGGGQLGGPFCYYWTLDGGYRAGVLVYKNYLPWSGR